MGDRSELYIKLFIAILISLVVISSLPGYLGEWRSPEKKATGYHPHGVFAGDLDGDGYTDIAIANSQSDNVTLYSRSASGWETPLDLDAGILPYGTYPESVVFGDVYGDNNLDLIIANRGNPPSDPASITIYPGNGAGLDPIVSKPTGTGTKPVHMAIGDLGGVGGHDLAVADKDKGEIKIFYNFGGSIVNTVNLTAQDGTSKVAVYDVDGVNGDDIIAINEFTNNISFFKRDVAGFFPVENLSTGEKPTGLSVGQIEGSTYIAVSNGDDSNVVLYQWTGSSWSAPAYLDAGSQPNDVAIADVNNDGMADIVTADLGSSTVSIIPRETGAWGTRLTRSVGSQPHSLAIADVDGDSYIDIITSNYAFAQITILKWVDNIEPYSTGIPSSFELDEDTSSNSTFIDLWKYFQDAETPDQLLDLSILEGSDDIITAEIASGRYLNIEIGPLGKDWNGARPVKVKCVDEKGAAVNATFNIVIRPINDAPEIISISGYSVDGREVTLTGDGFTSIQDEWYNRSIEYNDADGDVVAFSTNISEGSANPHPRFGINKDNGDISFLPTNEEAIRGFLNFNLTAKDPKGGISWLLVKLGVKNVNDKPVFDPIGSPAGVLTAYENVPYSYDVTAEDIDGDKLTFTDDSPLFQISSSGTISFTPATQDIGLHKFNISVKDNKGGTAEEQVELTVRNSNDPPETPKILSPTPEDYFYINENVAFKAGTGFDPDLAFGDKLSYFWDFGDGASVVGRNQTYKFKQKGTYNVSLSLEDSSGARSTVWVEVTIKGSEHIPPASLTERTITDRFNDVNVFRKDAQGNTIGEDPSIDISEIRTTRSGTNLVATLTMAGDIAVDATYEIYIITSEFTENDYVYIGSGSLPRPNLPIEGENYIFRGSYNEDLNISEGRPTKTGPNSIKFTMTLPEITSPGGFDFFAVVYYRDDNIFRIDSVGNGSNDPFPQMPTDNDDDDEEEGIWYFWYVIIGLGLLIMIMIILIIIVAVVSSKKRNQAKGKQAKKDELPPPPPPPTEIDAEIELLSPDDIIPEEDLAPPPPEDQEEVLEADSIEPPEPAVVTPQDSLDKMLLPMDQNMPKRSLTPPPDSPQPAAKPRNREDIFDELFSGPGAETPPNALEVECYNCHGTILVTSEKRPLVVKCSDCGTESMLP